VGDTPIPGYQLRRKIGEGSYGEVWEATKPGSPKTALKIVDLNLISKLLNKAESNKAARRELAATEELKKLSNPFLVRIYFSYVKTTTGKIIPGESADLEVDDAESGDPWRELFIGMELGECTLEDRLKECASVKDGVPVGIPVLELKPYILGVAEALDWLNGQKKDGKPLIHCDIKPTNIVLVQGYAKVCDYGVMRVLRPDLQATRVPSTPMYAPPECFIPPTAPTSTTDQFSLALTYYKLRTGTYPFAPFLLSQINSECDDAWHVLNRAKLKEQYEFHGIGKAERRVLRRALKRDYRHRWKSCEEFAEKLFQAIDHDERPKSMWGWLFGGSEGPGEPPPHSLAPYQPGDIPVKDHTVERVRATEGDDQWLEVRDSSGNHCELIIRTFSPSEASPDSTYPGEIQLEPAQDDWDRMVRLSGCKHSTLEQLRYWWKDEHGAVFSSVEDAPETSKPRELILKRPFAESLEERGKRLSTLTPMELRGWLGEIADLLDMLEDKGRYHGDIHPANIFVVDGKVRLGPARWQPLVDHTEGSRKYTESEVFAAPLPLETDSPSQADLKARDDQYALAVIYFRLRTGRQSPFTSNPADAIEAVMSDALDFAKRNECLDLRGLDETEDRTVRKALARSPNDRWRTCREFIDELTPASPATADSHEGVATRLFPAAVASAVCALLVAASFFIWRSLDGAITPGTPGLRPGGGSPTNTSTTNKLGGVEPGQPGQSGAEIPPVPEPVAPFTEFNTHLQQNQFVRALDELNRLWPKADENQCQAKLEELVDRWVGHQSNNIPKFDPTTPTAAFTATTHSGLPLPNDEIWKDRFNKASSDRLVTYWRTVFLQVKTDADRYFDQFDLEQSRIRYEELKRQIDLYDRIVSDVTRKYWHDIPWRIHRINAAEMLRDKREVEKTSDEIKKFLELKDEGSDSTERHYGDEHYALVRCYLLAVCHHRSKPPALTPTEYWRAILDAASARISAEGDSSQHQTVQLREFEATFLDREIADLDRLLAESPDPKMPDSLAMAISDSLQPRLADFLPEHCFRETLERALDPQQQPPPDLPALAATMTSLATHFSKVNNACRKTDLDGTTVFTVEAEPGVFTPKGFEKRRELYDLKLRALPILRAAPGNLRLAEPNNARGGAPTLAGAIDVWTDIRWPIGKHAEWTKSVADRINVDLDKLDKLPTPIEAILLPDLRRVCEKLRLRWKPEDPNTPERLSAEGKPFAPKLVRTLNRSLITHLVVLQATPLQLREWTTELRYLEKITSAAGDQTSADEARLLAYEFDLEERALNNQPLPDEEPIGSGLLDRGLDGYQRYLKWRWAAARDRKSLEMVEPATLDTLSNDWPLEARHAWQTDHRRHRLIEAMHRHAYHYLPKDDVFVGKTQLTNEALRLLDTSLKVADNHTHVQEIWRNSLSACYLLDKWLNPTRENPTRLFLDWWLNPKREIPLRLFLECLGESFFVIPDKPTAMQLLASHVYYSTRNSPRVGKAPPGDLLGRFFESLKLVTRENKALRVSHPPKEDDILGQFYRMIWVIIAPTGEPIPIPQDNEAKESMAIAHYFAALSGYRKQAFPGLFDENRQRAKDCCQFGLPFAAGASANYWTVKIKCLRIAILLDEWFDGIDIAGADLDKEETLPKTEIIDTFDRFAACALDLRQKTQALSSGKDEGAIRNFDKSIEEMEELFGPNGAAAQLSTIDRARFQIMLSKAHYTRGNSTDKPLNAWADAKEKKDEGEPYYHFVRAYENIDVVTRIPEQEELLDHVRFWTCQHQLMCLERLGCHLRLDSYYAELERLLFSPASDNELLLLARRLGTPTALLEHHLTRIRLIRQLFATRLDRFGRPRSQLRDEDFIVHLKAAMKEVMDLCANHKKQGQQIGGYRPLYEVADAMTIVPRSGAKPEINGELNNPLEFEQKVQEFLEGYMQQPGFQQDPRFGLPVTLYILSKTFKDQNVSRNLLAMAERENLWQGAPDKLRKEWFLGMVEWAERASHPDKLDKELVELENFAPSDDGKSWIRTYRKLRSEDVEAVAEYKTHLVKYAESSRWFVCRSCTRLLRVDYKLGESLQKNQADVKKVEKDKDDIKTLVLALGVIKEKHLGTLFPASDIRIPVGQNPNAWYASMPEVNARRLVEWYRQERFLDEFDYQKQLGTKVRAARKPFYVPIVQSDTLQKEVLQNHENQMKKFEQVLPLLK
jgi:serine/threonine protein kinase